jgi:Protein of unknown function (DUF1553)/Protein of unknown function (DUF1549)/Planctomycete cytochrome C
MAFVAVIVMTAFDQSLTLETARRFPEPNTRLSYAARFETTRRFRYVKTERGQKPMRKLTRFGLRWAMALCSLGAAARAGDGLRPVDFHRDIRPILSESCYPCHGPDRNKRKADLRLDRREGLFRSEDGTAIVAPGTPRESELFARVSAADGDIRMPPPGSGKALTPSQITLIGRWIAEGAAWKGHWAYIPPTRATLPAVHGTSTPANAIDRYIQERLQAEGLNRSPEADRITLIRRLNFDLIGLPAAPRDVDEFVSDSRHDAYERLVDRLLASPQFGERLAIFWLDLVRYADTTGYHGDNHVELYLYRDYVIRSFNANKPFDEFTIEQLAGDLLDGATDQTRIASGYNRLLLTTQEGGAQAKEYLAKYSADRVRNVSSVWLGATLGCAECHDHKYDPFLSREFYSLAAFFADIQETAVGVQPPTRFSTTRQAAELKRLDEQIAALQTTKKPSDEDTRRRTALERQKGALLEQIPTSLVAMSGPPRKIRILPRGNWLDESGAIVEPGVPGFLPPLQIKNRRATRLDLARWLVERENPLVARVLVNRLWKLVFGQGLVTTPDDFGSQGAWPTHPELLDWLACEFIETGWNVKTLLKRMVMSQTYRQTSAATEELLARDPANHWLARQNRFRLDAELVRDTALATSGLLCTRIGGPSVKPYQPAGYWIFLNFPKRDWARDHGANLYRRGLYTYWQRTFLHPSLLAFDASTREECVVQRPRSNTPLQALVLLNDPIFVEAARVLAARVVKEERASQSARLDRAFRLVLSRSPRTDEQQVLVGLFEKHRKEFLADPAAARALLATGDAPPPPGVDLAELAAWTSVARVLLNLQATFTRS